MKIRMVFICFEMNLLDNILIKQFFIFIDLWKIKLFRNNILDSFSKQSYIIF